MFDMTTAVERPAVGGRPRKVNPYTEHISALVEISEAGKAAPLTFTGEDAGEKARGSALTQLRSAAREAGWSLIAKGDDNPNTEKTSTGEVITTWYTYTVYLVPFKPRGPRKSRTETAAPQK